MSGYLHHQVVQQQQHHHHSQFLEGYYGTQQQQQPHHCLQQQQPHHNQRYLNGSSVGSASENGHVMPSSTNHRSHSNGSSAASGGGGSNGAEDHFGVGMTDEELSSLNIKDLNRKLKERGLPKATIEKIKQRRRTLKNRKYATDCREKKDYEVHNLEESKELESTDMGTIQADNARLRESVNHLKEKYTKMLEFAKKNKMPLRRRNVPGMPTTLASASSSEAGGDDSPQQ